MTSIISRLFLLVLTLTMVVFFQWYISIAFYYISLYTKTITSTLSFFFEVSPMLLLLYWSIPFIFLYKFIRGSLLVKDN